VDIDNRYLFGHTLPGSRSMMTLVEAARMDPETAVEIRRIQKFGHYARAACLILAVPLAILGLWILGNIAVGPTSSGFTVNLGAYEVAGDRLSSLPVKIWALAVTGVVLGIVFGGLFHLFRLFGSLASGSIYTKDNVFRIRQLGLLALAIAVLQIVLPLFSQLLLGSGVIDEGSVTPVTFGVGPDSLSMFIMAGLILLASWIMEVGRQVSEEAHELRREGELVI
jgi:hypothetical protein